MSFVKDAFDSLTGKTAAKKGVAASRRDIQAGKTGGIDAINTGYDAAGGYYDPYMEDQTGAFNALNAMTFGGDYDVSETPGFQWQMDNLSKRMNRELGARGRDNSTFGINAMSDAYQNMLGNEFGRQYGRVSDIAKRGYNAAQGMSNLDTSRGTNLANIYTGQAANLSNNSMERGNVGTTFSPMNQITSVMDAGSSLLGPIKSMFPGGGNNAMSGSKSSLYNPDGYQSNNWAGR